MRFLQERQINAEGSIDTFGAADGLKHQINRRAEIRARMVVVTCASTQLCVGMS